MSADRAAPPQLPAEEQARADFYGLLALLLYQPPDRELLATLAAAPPIAAEGDAPLAQAWGELTRAAREIDADAARREHFGLYVGTGKSEVSPYAGAYLSGSALRSPLVALRAFLGTHGLARREAVSEPEDHFAALCDVMRHLVCADDADFALQREFFDTFLWPAAPAFCEATMAATAAGFYSRVARFALSFFELEHTAFNMQ